MRILVVGGGGREHALCWAIAGSPLCDKLYCAPGNAGIAQEAECVSITAENIPAIVDFAQREQHRFRGRWAGSAAGAGAGGPADRCRHQIVRADGGGRGAGRLQGLHEGSLRQVWHSHRRLWPLHGRCGGERFHRRKGAPIVVKADGLAAGKGVIIAETVAEAEAAVDAMLTTASSAMPAQKS